MTVPSVTATASSRCRSGGRRSVCSSLVGWVLATSLAGCVGHVAGDSGAPSIVSSTAGTGPTGMIDPSATPGVPPTPEQVCASGATARLGLRALSEGEANEVVRAALDPTLAFAPGALGGNQALGGKFANARDRLTMDDAGFGKAFDEALVLGDKVFTLLKGQGNCLTQSPVDAACAAEQITHFARSLWRGNVADAAVQPLIDKYTSVTLAADTHEAMVQVFSALLLSPEFIYRFEFGNGAVAGRAGLTPRELAEGLAFFLTGRPPSEELLRAADGGQLDAPGGFDAQVDALLEHPMVQEQFATVFSQVFAYRNSRSKGNDATALTPAVAQQMVDETDSYLKNAYRQNWSIAQLLTDQHSDIPDQLAAYYDGVPFTAAAASAPANHEFAREKRYGLLTQGSMLLALSDPNKVAIVHRGRVLREKVLCRDVPKPPPGAANLLPAPLPDQTERERLVVHVQNPVCAACHNYMDGIGQALDSFGSDGRYRDQTPTNDGKSSRPTDSSGTLQGVSSGTVNFANTGEFFNWLAGSDDAGSCMASTFVEFAQGANLLPAGDCGAASAFLKAAPGMGVKDLIKHIVKDKVFRERVE